MTESESEISEEHSDDSEASSDFNPFGEDDTDSDGMYTYIININTFTYMFIIK